MKVLVIEDQPVAALQLLAVLRSLGHEAFHAKNSVNALVQLKEGGYRAIVSDWLMPVIDGLELCRLIRGREGADYVYFILVSSNRVTKENRQLALAAGVDDFLTKPVDPDELGMRLHVAERIIGLTAQVKQLEAFLPICSYCKKIREDGNYWQEVDAYLAQQGTKFSHGICPDCYQREMVPQLKALGLDPAKPKDGS